MSRYPTVDRLLVEASAQTGRGDFGPGDFRDGLEVLPDSLHREGHLAPDADGAVTGDFRRRPANGPEVEAWPAERAEPLRRRRDGAQLRRTW